MTGPRWKKVCLILTWIIAPAVFLAGLFFLVLTPYSLRNIWLPAAARSAGVTAQAEKISLISLTPFRVRAVNFHYADSDVSLDIAKIITGLSFLKLKKHQPWQKSTPNPPGKRRRFKVSAASGNALSFRTSAHPQCAISASGRTARSKRVRENTQ